MPQMIGNSPGNETQILTRGEAADLIRCSKAHLSNLIAGRVPNTPPLPFLRIGRRVLFRRDSLAAWLTSIESHSGGDA